MYLKSEPFSPLDSPDSGYGDSHHLHFKEQLNQQLGLLEQQLQLSQEEHLEGDLINEEQLFRKSDSNR